MNRLSPFGLFRSPTLLLFLLILPHPVCFPLLPCTCHRSHTYNVCFRTAFHMSFRSTPVLSIIVDGISGKDDISFRYDVTLGK